MRTIKKLKKHLKERRSLYTHCAIFGFSFLFFLFGLDRIPLEVAGESHYTRGGIEILNNGINTNWAHPPLGKILIGIGIKIFGFNPLGWRVMSVLFGALTLNAMFILGRILFQSELLALEVVILCFLNQFLFVTSRLASLDGFMFAFVSWGLVFFFKYKQSRKSLHLIASAITLGLAIATKWFAIVPALLCVFFYLTDKRNRNYRPLYYCVAAGVAAYFLMFGFTLGMTHPSWGARLDIATREFDPRPDPRPGVRDPRPSGVPIYSSLDTGLAAEKLRPHIEYGFWDIIQVQLKMFKAQLKYKSPYPHTSDWYNWPVMLEHYPLIWRGGADRVFLGIVLAGNPLILWFGFFSACVSLYAWIRYKNETAKIVSFLYFSLWLSWAVIPRKSLFLFYYFPAAMILGLNIVFAFQFFKISFRNQMLFVSACAVVFAFFYPILSGVLVSLKFVPYGALISHWGMLP